MSEIDLDALEAAAKAASPGPWIVCRTMASCGPVSWHVSGAIHGSGKPICEDACDTNLQTPIDTTDADFIAAANPAAVLELVRCARETDQLRQRVAELKAASPRTEPLDNNTTRYTFEHGVLEASYVAGAATVVVRK